jgi:hypothetical protein
MPTAAARRMGGVVDPVPEEADHVADAAQRGDDALLVLGHDLGEHARVEHEAPRARSAARPA